jgi:hypothetical protein
MLDEDFPLDLPPEKEFIAGTDAKYCDFACDGAMDAVRMAFANLRPLKMDVKSGVRHGLAFCRRAVMSDGSLSMFPANGGRTHPLGPDIL